MADGAGPELKLLVEDNRRAMHITINDAGKLRAGMVLTAEQLDGTIAALCKIRSEMQPEVPVDYAAGIPTVDIKGTHFNFEVDSTSGEMIFSLRDPGRGWLSLRFGARLLERMLKITRAAGTATRQ